MKSSSCLATVPNAGDPKDVTGSDDIVLLRYTVET